MPSLQPDASIVSSNGLNETLKQLLLCANVNFELIVPLLRIFIYPSAHASAMKFGPTLQSLNTFFI